jgi:hypothetical protein
MGVEGERRRMIKMEEEEWRECERVREEFGWEVMRW